MHSQPGPTAPTNWPLAPLTELFEAECVALVNATLRLARDKGYTDQTSAMRSAWTESAKYINESLVAYLSHPLRNEGMDGRNDYRLDPRFDRLRHVAQRHHDVGVPLELHNGLFKLYRKAYLRHFSTLLGQSSSPGQPSAPGQRVVPPLENPRFLLERIEDFFDELDLATLAPWAEGSPSDTMLADSLRRLTRERDQYFAALESLRNPVFIASEDGELVTANRAALQIFLDLPEAGALTYRLALQPHRAELQAIVDEILATEGSEWSAIWMQTGHGNRCFDIRVRRVEDSSGKLDRRKIVLMHDVTEHHLAVQKAREAERTMSLFLGAMAHEIRAPLHSVLGAASLMKGCARDEIERLIDLLDASACSLSATLDNVLSFSRFSHQTPLPRPDRIALHDVLGDLVRIHSMRARHLGVPLRLEIGPEVPEHVHVDWSMTQQVLSNLVRNALRFDDGRGVGVAVHVEDAAMLVFRVTDHGPGLPAAMRGMLTDTPAELRPRVTEDNGSGLGLAIAQRMTLALGGRVAALDCAEGTVIEVRLPLVAGADQEHSVATHAPLDKLDMACLVIDDDPISARVTVAMLERLGLSVDYAESLVQAYGLCDAEAGAYDIFVVDYRLPDGTGVDFARRLRQDPALCNAPIFLLSANVEWVRQVPADARLFVALLKKPLAAASLAQAIYEGVRPPPATDMLQGLSPQVQRRMAQVFADNWSDFRPVLAAADVTDRDDNIAGHAHKLASGAKIFGLTSISGALLEVERAHTDPGADVAARLAAHEALLACALPANWADHIGTRQT